MTRGLPLIVCLCLGTPALAEQLHCSGQAPNWTLTIDGETGAFVFPAPTEMDVVLDTPAEGLDWPRAYTLIGERDTAIAVIERQACGGSDYQAHVLTQRAETPIFLTGCCQALE